MLSLPEVEGKNKGVNRQCLASCDRHVFKMVHCTLHTAGHQHIRLTPCGAALSLKGGGLDLRTIKTVDSFLIWQMNILLSMTVIKELTKLDYVDVVQTGRHRPRSFVLITFILSACDLPISAVYK
jgi:hypothetical protein